MRDWNRVLAGVLAACMLFSQVPAGVLAAEPEGTVQTGETTHARENQGNGAADPTVPETDPTVPETDPTVPETDPTVPETDPTVPETDPTVPETDPTVPAKEPGKQSDRPLFATAPVMNAQGQYPVEINHLEDTEDRGNLATDHYFWDHTAKVLTLDHASAQSVIFPSGCRATIKSIGNCYISNIQMESGLGQIPALTIAGSGTLEVEYPILGACNALTIEEGASLTCRTGISVGDNIGSRVVVNGHLEVLKGHSGYGIFCGALAVGSRGAVNIYGDGADDSGIKLGGTESDASESSFQNVLTISDGGTIRFENCMHYAIEIYLRNLVIQDESQLIQNMLSIPDNYIPEGGSFYFKIVRGDDEAAATLIKKGDEKNVRLAYEDVYGPKYETLVLPIPAPPPPAKKPITFGNFEDTVITTDEIYEPNATSDPANVTLKYTYQDAQKNELTEKPRAQGTYYVTVSGENETHKGSRTITLTILYPIKGSLSQNGVLTYNGQEQSAQIKNELTGEENIPVTVKYGLTAEDCSLNTVPGFTVPGDYPVFYQASADKHKTVSGSFPVTIKKADLEVKAKDQTVLFGDSIQNTPDQVTVTGLGKGDHVAKITLKEDWNTNTITPSGIRIQDGSGQDITEKCYGIITYVNGSLTGQKRNPVIQQAPAARNLTYNTKAQQLVSAGSSDGGTMKYALTAEGPFLPDIPVETNAGTYQVYYQVEGNDHYLDGTGYPPIKVTIAPKEVLHPDVELSQREFPYDGSPKEPTVTAVRDEDGNVIPEDGTEYTVDYQDNIDVSRRAVVLIRDVPDGNYKLPASTPVYFEIYQFELGGIHADKTEAVYGDIIRIDFMPRKMGWVSPMASLLKLTQEGNTARVSLDGVLIDTIPNVELNRAVSYQLDTAAAAKVQPSRNFFDGQSHTISIDWKGSGIGESAKGELAVTLSKRPVTPVIPGNLTLTYNGTTVPEGVTMELSGKIEGDDLHVSGKASLNNKDAGSRILTATGLSLSGRNADCYVLAQNQVSGPVTVLPLEAKLRWTNTRLSYNGNAQAPTAEVINLCAGDTADVRVEGAQIQPGTHTATAADITNRNYKLPAGASCSFAIVEGQARVDMAPAARNPQYCRAPQDLITAGRATGGQLFYRLGENGGWDTQLPQAENAGEYTIYYKVKAAPGYLDSQVYSLPARIDPKQVHPTVILDQNEFEYTGQEIRPGVTVKDGNDIIPYEEQGVQEYRIVYSNNTLGTTTACVRILDAPGGNYALPAEGTEVHFIIHQRKIDQVKLSSNRVFYGDSFTITIVPGEMNTSGFLGMLLGLGGESNTATISCEGVDIGVVPGVTLKAAVSYTVNTANRVLPPELFDGHSHDITVSWRGTSPLHTSTATVSLVLSKRPVTPSLKPGKVGTYNGSTDAGTMPVELSGVLTGDAGMVEASGHGSLDRKDVGTRTLTVDGITLTGSRAGYYALSTATAVQTVTVKPLEAKLLWSHVSFPYDGASHKPTAEVKNLLSGDKVTVDVSGAMTDAGTYTATVTDLHNPNYSIPAAASCGFEITKVPAVLTQAPKALNVTFDGKVHPLVKAGTAEGGKLVYSLTAAGTYQPAIPTGKAIGTYQVYYKVEGDANHEDTAIASLKVYISGPGTSPRTEDRFMSPVWLALLGGSFLALAAGTAAVCLRRRRKR